MLPPRPPALSDVRTFRLVLLVFMVFLGLGLGALSSAVVLATGIP